MSSLRWSTIARGVIEGGQRSRWVHMGGGQGSPAVHWDAVNDRKGCIEFEFDSISQPFWLKTPSLI